MNNIIIPFRANIGVQTTAPFSNTKSLSFDGVDDYLTTNTLSSLVDNKSKLSISLWVNLLNASEINRISGKYTSLSRYIGITTYLDEVRLAVSNEVLDIFGKTSAVLSDNIWHHIVCIFDGSQAVSNDRVKIYVDNVNEVLSFSGNMPTSTYDFTLEPTNPNWYIGQIGYSMGSNELRGMLDEYAIYSDVALTSVEVSEIYNSGVPNDLSTLTVTPDLWYRNGDNDVYPTIADVGSLASNPGTMINMDAGDIVSDVPL